MAQNIFENLFFALLTFFLSTAFRFLKILPNELFFIAFHQNFSRIPCNCFLWDYSELSKFTKLCFNLFYLSFKYFFGGQNRRTTCFNKIWKWTKISIKTYYALCFSFFNKHHVMPHTNKYIFMWRSKQMDEREKNIRTIFSVWVRERETEQRNSLGLTTTMINDHV